jgi:imidazolonepropionase-like amidohydrolase
MIKMIKKKGSQKLLRETPVLSGFVATGHSVNFLAEQGGQWNKKVPKSLKRLNSQSDDSANRACLYPGKKVCLTIIIIRTGRIMIRILLLFLLTSVVSAQGTRPNDGLRNATPRVTAFTGGTLHISPDQTITDGILLIRDGRIAAAGKKITIPKDATVVRLDGAHVYPGFIDACSDYGVHPIEQPAGKPGPTPFIDRNSSQHWNAAVNPEFSAAAQFQPDSAKARKLRAAGFTAVQAAMLDGIFRGSAATVLTSDANAPQRVLNPEAAQFISFRKGNSPQDYPNSLMGSIALIRQTLYDADWYARAVAAYEYNHAQERPELNAALQALKPVISKKQRVVFAADDELDLLRAGQIAREFNLLAAYRGSGYEYRRLDEIETLKAPVILPLNFPEAPDVASPEAALEVSLERLKHWDAAPDNPARLAAKGIKIAFTANGLESPDKMLPAIRLAVKRGLNPQTALAALTTIPAQLAGINPVAGTLEKAKLANLVIVSGDLFDDESMIRSVWIEGEEFPVNRMVESDYAGTWQVQGETTIDSLIITNKSSLVYLGGNKYKSTFFERDRLRFRLVADPDGIDYRVEMTLDGQKMSGSVLDSSGVMKMFTARRIREKTKKKKTSVREKPALFATTFPDMAFGLDELPRPVKRAAFRNATIWTNTGAGILPSADLIIANGKIEKVGKNLEIPQGIPVIDASGRHITPGLIDEHSHVAISRGVNEGTEAVTAEVRIGDVLNSDDINIYRQLSGGVTTSQLLHGSANPIGGQAQVIKLRWGSAPEALKFSGIDPTIKFALGENVKQSNWGDLYTKRYPQTRLGVEQIMRDAFQAASEYQAAWKKYNALSASQKKQQIPPRRDLELDALVEILNSERFIHCHSYVQSEILMLMRLAEDFGFRVGTFTHILEGYKVADEMREHGAMGSTFADWWAYKFEVYEAIPYNSALMHRAGVVTSINSDDAEMGRRLNHEAAKAMRYGGISAEEALKMATLNSARQLHIEDRVGSIAAGMDADIVLWNGDPLSVYSSVEQTWIDGARWFDRKRDQQMRREMERQRVALIDKILGSADDEKTGTTVSGKTEEKNYHCEDNQDYMRGGIGR